jgi:hypothetical protein
MSENIAEKQTVEPFKINVGDQQMTQDELVQRYLELSSSSNGGAQESKSKKALRKHHNEESLKPYI